MSKSDLRSFNQCYEAIARSWLRKGLRGHDRLKLRMALLKTLCKAL